jgi:hypothetical protein
VAYSTEDFKAAMRVMARPDTAHALWSYACQHPQPTMEVLPQDITPLLQPALAVLLEQLFVQPPDFQKELFAIHMWNVSAHEELDASSKVCCILCCFFCCIRTSKWMNARHLCTYGKREHQKCVPVSP